MDPYADWDGFLEDLKQILSGNELTYHPLRKRLRPWIDLAVLERSYGPKSNSILPFTLIGGMTTIAVILFALLMQRYSLT
jgi:hypothetical protein